MNTRELKISLPDDIAREAERAGLLNPKAIEGLFRSALREKRTKNFFEMADQLANLNVSPLTEKELEEEIQAARQERLAQRESRS